MAYKGSDLDPEFKKWFRAEKARITKILKAKGCTKIELDYGFYYFSGFFTDANGQAWYLSCSDVRHFPYTQLLYCTAKNYKDYSGGRNQYIGVNDLENWHDLDRAMQNAKADAMQTENWEAFDEAEAQKIVNG